MLPPNGSVLQYAVADARLIDWAPDGYEYSNEWPQNLLPYFGALFESYGEYDLRPDLNSLQVPQLVIHGKKDGVPLAGARAWVSDKPNAKLLVLSPAGHFSFIEQPESFFSAVKMFLNGEWPQNTVAEPGQ